MDFHVPGIPPHCSLLHQTLNQCNKTNISHLTRDAFPLGFKTHWPQLARPKEILICSSQDMFCKERGSAKRVCASGDSLLLLLESIPLTLMGAQCVWELWKKLHQGWACRSNRPWGFCAQYFKVSVSQTGVGNPNSSDELLMTSAWVGL